MKYHLYDLVGSCVPSVESLVGMMMDHCWHFLTSLLGGVSSQQRRQGMRAGMSQQLQKDPQAHGYTVVAFHQKYSGYHYLYFPEGWRGCVKMFTSYITMTL